MSTPRPTRSRISSPFMAANASGTSANTTVESAERPKTLLDKWVEPPLPAPRPSFADAGMARHGVVANMAPLGTRPSLKVMKSARAGSADSNRYAPLARKTGAALSASLKESDSEMTPEPIRVATPVAEPPLQDSPFDKTESVEPSLSTIEEPRPTTPAEQSSAPGTTSPAPQPSPVAEPHQVQSNSVMHENLNAGDDSSASATQPPIQPASPGIAALLMAAQPKRVHQSPYGPPPPQSYQASPHPPPAYQPPSHSPQAQAPAQIIERPINVEKTDRIVEAAVTHAIQAQRWPTAYALRTLYDDHRSNARIVRLFDSIYFQTATPEQRQEFAILMKCKKKEGKKDKTADYYFNGDGSDQPAPQPQPNPKAQQTIYTALVGNGPVFQNTVYQTPYRTPYANTPPRRPSTGATPASTSAEKQTVATPVSPPTAADDCDAAHPNKKHKANDFQPSDVEVPTTVNGHDNNTTTPEPAVARSRFNSVSSASSLSSVDEGVLVAGEFLSPVRGSHTPRAHANNAESPSHARNQDQPISSSTTLGPKTHTFSSATLPSSSSLHKYSSVDDMPSVVPRSSPAPLPHQVYPIFKARKDYSKVTGPAYDANDFSSRQRRKAKDVTERNAEVAESFDRTSVAVGQDLESSDADSLSFVPSKRPRVRLINTSKKAAYESEAESSPTLLEFRPDLAPGGSRSVSRAGTPINSGRPTRKTKSGSGLRIKTSPMKKKGGTAGIPRAGGERSPVGNGASSHLQEDNDDYCSSCGGNGDLVCCDGCVRSFHFKCVDPPIQSGAALPDEWYCNECMSRRNGRGPEADGIFGTLLSKIEKQNSKAFALTKEIREYFEGVKTGTEGEYEEVVPEKPKNKQGWEEPPDYFRLRDNKGNTILCHLCHEAASAPDRMIVPCAYCGLSWHLDCLDPPLAKEPPLAKKWRCPAHIDDLLAIVPGNLGPAHRFRKIKGASAVKPAFSRGTRNNGYIEIENSPSGDEEEDFYELNQYGHVYKLPEEGIKLDFISQVKQKLHGGGYNPQYPSPYRKREQQHRPPLTPFEERSLKEKNCALIMAQLSTHVPNITQTLIEALISQAPPEILSVIAQGDPTNIAENSLSDRDDASLAAMQALIAGMRDGIKKSTTPVKQERESTPSKPEVVDDEMLID